MTIELIDEVKQALIEGNFHIDVVSVARSGMSRKLKLYIVHNNKIIELPVEYLKLAGCNQSGRINGCGMDMLWLAHNNLCKALFNKLANDFPSYNIY